MLAFSSALRPIGTCHFNLRIRSYHLEIDFDLYSAVDALVEKLAKMFTPKDMFRLVSARRKPHWLDPTKDYKRFNQETGMYEMPTVEQLKSYKIVLTTRCHDRSGRN